MAIALRPRPSASMISSRYGSHALALGARPGRATGAESVDTFALVAGFAASESVDTARKWPVLPARVGGHQRREIAGFAFDSLGDLVHAPESPRLSDSR